VEARSSSSSDSIRESISGDVGFDSLSAWLVTELLSVGIDELLDDEDEESDEELLSESLDDELDEEDTTLRGLPRRFGTGSISPVSRGLFLLPFVRPTFRLGSAGATTTSLPPFTAPPTFGFSTTAFLGRPRGRLAGASSAAVSATLRFRTCISVLVGGILLGLPGFRFIGTTADSISADAVGVSSFITSTAKGLSDADWLSKDVAVSDDTEDPGNSSAAGLGRGGRPRRLPVRTKIGAAFRTDFNSNGFRSRDEPGVGTTDSSTVSSMSDTGRPRAPR
jgi:hypothetical protein